MVKPSPTVRAVLETLAPLYPSVTFDDLAGPRQSTRFTEPRHLAMSILVNLDWSYLKTARAFGRKDHTCVVHARRAAKKRHDPRFVERLTNEVRERIGQ